MFNFMDFQSTLSLFDEMLKSPGVDFKDKINPKQAPQQKVMQIKKNIVLCAPSDSSGCGHIRCIFPFTYLNSVFGKSRLLNPVILPFYTFQSNILIRARSLFFQRQMDPRHVEIIKMYKELKAKYGYKMVYDIDDFIYQGPAEGECIPKYNFGSEKITDEIRNASIEIMNMMDLVCVSSDFLGSYLKEKRNVTTPIRTIPNSICLYMWGTQRKKPIKEKIARPKIIYTGSPTHWSERHKMLGDWENSWVEYIRKSIRDNKIDFFMMGCPSIPKMGAKPPFFFEEFAGRSNFKAMGWVNSFQYHLPIKNFAADFSIGPLVQNYFNYSKSDIKAIESYASGSAFIGTVFTNGMPSPYDSNFIKAKDNISVKEIEELIDFNSYPENYNTVIKNQYNFLKTKGRYLESPEYTNLLTSVI